MDNKTRGKIGEEIAVKYLLNHGYEILERNFQNKMVSGPLRGEIDLVAKKEDTIYFFEVKTLFRSTKNNLWNPETKVDRQKLRKIQRTAESWLLKNKISFERPMQFDVLSIIVDPMHKRAKVRHIKNVY